MVKELALSLLWLWSLLWCRFGPWLLTSACCRCSQKKKKEKKRKKEKERERERERREVQGQVVENLAVRTLGR